MNVQNETCSSRLLSNQLHHVTLVVFISTTASTLLCPSICNAKLHVHTVNYHILYVTRHELFTIMTKNGQGSPLSVAVAQFNGRIFRCPIISLASFTFASNYLNENYSCEAAVPCKEQNMWGKRRGSICMHVHFVRASRSCIT